MTVKYIVIEEVPSAGAFYHPQVTAGTSPRPLEGARARLPCNCYGMHIPWQETPIAMGRIVGDGVINFDIVDVTVDPAHQGKGLDQLVMEKLIAWLDANTFDGAYITLVADVPGLYTRFGFENVRPESEGMARVWRARSR